MEWIIDRLGDGMMIREFLKTEQSFSRRIIKAVVHDGGKILVNGEAKTVRHVLKAGDRLAVHFPEEEKGNKMKAQAMELDIVYEDDAVLIVNKPANMATIPSLHHPCRTIANGVLAHYEKNGIPYTVHVVTRLDRDTSGLLLIAKDRYSHSLLSKEQKQGLIRRKYLAITEGVPENKAGVIDAKIGRKENSIIKRTVTDEGKDAFTEYKVIGRSKDHALLLLQPKTGRTHQIRVHLSFIGHPLAGDDLYGGHTDKIKRQALHCAALDFIHPLTKKRMIFKAELAPDMKAVLENATFQEMF